VLRAAAHDPSDTKLGSAIRSLLSDPDFGSLKPPEEKTAVLSQVANYPDARAINNINRMLAKDWFRDQDLDNKQRSLKTIADLSSHQGDRTIIDPGETPRRELRYQAQMGEAQSGPNLRRGRQRARVPSPLIRGPCRKATTGYRTTTMVSIWSCTPSHMR
jgi:hypothetical protein